MAKVGVYYLNPLLKDTDAYLYYPECPYSKPWEDRGERSVDNECNHPDARISFCGTVHKMGEKSKCPWKDHDCNGV